jgi:hypothetical protein
VVCLFCFFCLLFVSCFNIHQFLAHLYLLLITGYDLNETVSKLSQLWLVVNFTMLALFELCEASNVSCVWGRLRFLKSQSCWTCTTRRYRKYVNKAFEKIEPLLWSSCCCLCDSPLMNSKIKCTC